MTFHAQTVADCWKLAREQAKAYQRLAHSAPSAGERVRCLAKRDAADRIALTIRYGPRPLAQTRRKAPRSAP